MVDSTSFLSPLEIINQPWVPTMSKTLYLFFLLNFGPMFVVVCVTKVKARHSIRSDTLAALGLKVTDLQIYKALKSAHITPVIHINADALRPLSMKKKKIPYYSFWILKKLFTLFFVISRLCTVCA